MPDETTLIPKPGTKPLDNSPVPPGQELQLPTDVELTESDIAAFDSMMPGKPIQNFDPAKKEVPKPIEVPKAEQTEIVTEEPGGEKTVEVPKAPTSRDERVKDLGLTEKELGLLKKMPNEAFEYVVSRLEDGKKLSTTVKELQTKVEQSKTSKFPDTFLEHPNAYQITETYQELSKDVSLGRSIVDHYKKALVNIEKGLPFRYLTQMDDGQIRISDKDQEPTPEAKIQVQQMLQSAYGEVSNVERELKDFVKGFNGRHEQVRAYMEERENAIFERYKDPKAPQYKLVNEVLGSIPAEIRSTPLARMLAKSVAMNMELSTALKNMNEKNKQAQESAAILKANGPSRSTESAIAAKDPQEVGWEDFAKMVR